MPEPVQTIAEPNRLSTNSTAQTLMRRLQAARHRTLMLASDLNGEQLLGSRLAIVNPPLWEIAHVAWFQEHWCLRYRGPDDLAPSLVKDADGLYNSAIAAADVKERLASLGAEPMPLPPEDFGRYVRAEIEKWAKAVAESGVKVD